MKKETILIAGIFLLALFLRLHLTNNVPVSLKRDEVGLGYDAFSLLRTGKDQYGKLLPVTLRSSDDYKPANYAYLSIVFISFFGPSQLAVRLASVLTGSLSVFLFYLLVKNLFSRTQKLPNYLINKASLLAAFVLTLSPWHIQYSRAAYEVNASLFFLLAGLATLVSLNRAKRNAILSGIFFGLGFLTYHSIRFIGPVLIISALFLERRNLHFKTVGHLLAICGFFFLLILPSMFSKEANIRFEVLNIFIRDVQRNETYREESAKALTRDFQTNSMMSGKIVHNRRSATIRYENVIEFIRNFFNHLTPNFLLIGETYGYKEQNRNHAPGYGLMHPWEYFFLILGFIFYLKILIDRHTLIILFWLILGLIPSAISWDAPNSWRSLAVVPSLSFFSAFGIIWLYLLIKKESKILLSFFSLSLATFVGITVFFYLHSYLVHLNYETSQSWRYGRREAVFFAESIKNKYKKIIVSSQLDDPYLYFLFYLKFDPVRYLREGGTVSGGWTGTKNHFSIYEFKPINYEQTKFQHGILLIGLPEEFPGWVRPIKIINYLDGQEAIRIVET